MRQLEEKYGEPIETILRRHYYDDGLSQAQVAKKLRVPEGTLAGWMVRLGINQRRLAEGVGALSAEHAPKELAG
jgi:DNA-binding transcriptional regulator LsrR (DeoR family)